jgi:hypothetical protein
MNVRTIKSTQLPKFDGPLFWEGTKKFNKMKRVTYVLDSYGNGKDAVISRLSTESYLVPIIVSDFIIKMFFDDIGLGITIFRVIDITDIAFPKVEVIKRKPSDSDEWQINDETEQITDDFVLSRIDDILEKTINTK